MSKATIKKALSSLSPFQLLVIQQGLIADREAAVLAERERCARIAEECFNRAPAEIVTLIRGGK